MIAQVPRSDRGLRSVAAEKTSRYYAARAWQSLVRRRRAHPMTFGGSLYQMRAPQVEANHVRETEEAEEESMTPYSAKELVEGWEFKIIRSTRKLFGRREYRERVLAEERRAGWVLVEVFDDGRIRLRRPRPLGGPEQHEGYDPFRTILDDWMEPASPAQRLAQRLALACLAVGAVVGVLFATGVLR